MTTCQVSLPSYFSSFEGIRKTLNINQMGTIMVYCSNITDIQRANSFNSGNYFGIVYFHYEQCYDEASEYSVFALSNSLDDGPEYYINKNIPRNNELRKIVVAHLEANPQLGMKIEQFY